MISNVSAGRLTDTRLLSLCIGGSVAVHALFVMLLPEWNALREPPPRPLAVELQQQKLPEIVPPQPLPMETRPEPVTRELLKPVQKATAVPLPVLEPLLTVPSETPPLPSPVVAVVPEQRSAPLPPQVAEAPRAPPAPVTPPRSDASYLNNPRPAYPQAARRRGDQGTVLVRVVVSAEGLANSVGLEKSSGHSSLDEVAVTTVKSWRFVPARQGGQAIESPYVVPVVFRID